MTASKPDRRNAEEAVTSDDALDVFCDRARELFERQQQRVQRLEIELSTQIEAAIDEINSGQNYVAEREEQFSQLDRKLAKLSRERDQALEARAAAESLLDEARGAISQVSHEQHELRVQLSQCHKQLNARADELKDLRARLRDATDEPSSQLTDELSRVATERDTLEAQLRETQQQLAEASQGTSIDTTELDDLRERFEKAVQEIRELKKRNGELNDQIARLRSDTTQQDETPAGGFDWEAQKRRLMLQLDADFDESNPEEASDKLTVEGTIRITDSVIADKDREIKELQQLLENQSSSIGDVAVGAAAIAGFLDQDELISQERESLKRLQDEWREKLRQAEIDISVERARLGRERTELQGQLQSMDQQRQQDESDGEQLDDKQPRGRWRRRLGLKDD